MKRYLPIFLGVLLPGLAACNEIIPEFKIRDDYLGRSFLQPGKTSEPMEHDDDGNPLLDGGGFRIPFPNPFRY